MTAPRARKGAPRRPPAPRPRPAPAACARTIDLWAFLDDELTAARARATARHVATCLVCAPVARRLRAMLEACRSAGCRKLPPDVRARARARVRALVRGTDA